jgi:hypothetical protein
MNLPAPPDADRCERILCHMARALKTGMIVTIYFSICVIIMLVILGARR